MHFVVYIVIDVVLDVVLDTFFYAVLDSVLIVLLNVVLEVILVVFEGFLAFKHEFIPKVVLEVVEGESYRYVGAYCNHACFFLK